MQAYNRVPEAQRDRLAALIGSRDRFIGGSADTMYIPGRHRATFMSTLALFLETNCFLEIAAPTALHLALPPGEEILFVDHVRARRQANISPPFFPPPPRLGPLHTRFSFCQFLIWGVFVVHVKKFDMTLTRISFFYFSFFSQWWIWQPPFDTEFVRGQWAQGREVDSFHTFHWGEPSGNSSWEPRPERIGDMRQLFQDSAARQGISFPKSTN